MMLFTTKVRNLTIPEGSQYSDVVQGEFETQDAETITLIAPADMDNAIPFQIQVSGNPLATSEDSFSDLEDQNGTPILAPPSGKAREYVKPAWPSWRIKAGAAVVAETTFQVHKTHY